MSGPTDTDDGSRSQTQTCPRTAKALVEPNESAPTRQAQREAPASPIVAREAPPAELAEGPSAPPTRFDGPYQIAAEDALKQVSAGKTTWGLGSKGAVVREVQEPMQWHGASFTKLDASRKVVKDYGADGFVGDVTKRELEKLQKQWGLPVAGELDQKTMGKLRQAPDAAESELQRVTECEMKKFGEGLGGSFRGLQPEAGSSGGPSRMSEATAPSGPESSRSDRTALDKPKPKPQPESAPLTPTPTSVTYIA